MPFGAYIQSVGASTSSVTSSDLAYPSNNAANALLTCWARLYGDAGSISLTDTRGNTWVPTISFISTNDTQLRLDVYHVLSGTAGANTVTLATTGAVTRRWALVEHTGPGVLDDTTTAEGITPDDSPTAGNLVTTVATELLIKCMVYWADTDATVGASFTERIATAGDRTNVADRLVTSTGSYATAYSATGSEPWIMSAASFYEAVSAPSFIPKPFMLQQAVKRASLY